MSNNTQNLIKHINEYLSPKYSLIVEDIPDGFIDVSRNTTNSTKCISLKKINDDVTYTDWYYNDFNLEKIKDECYIMSVIDKDRDVDVLLAFEFKEISNKITSALNTFNF